LTAAQASGEEEVKMIWRRTPCAPSGEDIGAAAALVVVVVEAW